MPVSPGKIPAEPLLIAKPCTLPYFMLDMKPWCIHNRAPKLWLFTGMYVVVPLTKTYRRNLGAFHIASNFDMDFAIVDASQAPGFCDNRYIFTH